MNVSILFRPKNRVRDKIFRTFRETFSNFSPSRKFFRRPNFFSKFSWHRCDSFGPKIVKIGAILTVFRPFEIPRKFCPVRAPSIFSMRIQNTHDPKIQATRNTSYLTASKSLNGRKIARMAPILTIFGPNRSQRRNLFFEKFSNERRRP